MPVTGGAVRVVVYLSEDDRQGRRPMAEVLLEKARQEGLAGATLWRGIEGFGASGHVRTARFPDAAVGLPLALELMDEAHHVEAFLLQVRELVKDCLVTREEVEVTRFNSSHRA
jgi:PII-like signaling protein